MWYLVMGDTRMVRKMLDEHNIEYGITEDFEIYTAYDVDTIVLLDDNGVVSHAIAANELETN